MYLFSQDVFVFAINIHTYQHIACIVTIPHLIIDKAYLFCAKSMNLIPMSADKYLSFQIKLNVVLQ